jgi:threonine/homoserine/homoserine lactone efflux protein
MMLTEHAIAFLLTMGMVHLIALASPGPDFALILQACTQ